MRKRRVGRPKKAPGEAMTAQLPAAFVRKDFKKRLDAYAAENGIGLSEAIRRLLEAALNASH